MDVSIDRTSPTVMAVSWTPLSYVEARGFISHYTVAYSPLIMSQAHTMLQTVPGMDSSTTRIEGLDPDTLYTVQVSATTGAGRNKFSPCVRLYDSPGPIMMPLHMVYKVMFPTGPEESGILVGIVVEGIAALIVITALITVNIILVVKMLRYKKYVMIIMW